MFRVEFMSVTIAVPHHFRRASIDVESNHREYAFRRLFIEEMKLRRVERSDRHSTRSCLQELRAIFMRDSTNFHPLCEATTQPTTGFKLFFASRLACHHGSIVKRQLGAHIIGQPENEEAEVHHHGQNR